MNHINNTTQRQHARPNSRRPISRTRIDGQVGRETRKHHNETAVEEGEHIDGDAEAAEGPAGGRERFAEETLAQNAPD